MATAALASFENAASRNMASKITRWSLNSLARAKRDMVDPQNGAILARPVLDMAQDVTVRLGEQQTHVERLQEYVQERLERRQPEERQQNMNTNSKVIATSSYLQPYWWKQMQKQPDENTEQKEAALKKARQNLHNLNMLHESTQEIAQTFTNHLENKPDDVLDKRERKWLKAAFSQIRDRHALTVENLAEFVITTRPYWETPVAMDDTVMDFLCGRLGVQLLCEHALAPRGIIETDCELKTVLQEAISEAQLLCESNYSHLVTAAPEVVIVSHTLDRKDQFTIVRPWVHYVLVELLKNAMAVSMERMTNDENTCNLLPPTIYLSIDDHHQSAEDNYLSIDIMDQGGGFSNPDLAKNTDILFEFVRTKDRLWDRLDDQQTYAMMRSPMQGLGVGLCLSRLMMQHFGGTVDLSSHPPLGVQYQQTLTADGRDELQSGCVASIKLLKDLDHPEHLSAQCQN